MARRLALLGALAVAAVGIAASPAMADTSSCSNPLLNQVFRSFGDSNWYTLPGGESYDNFNGTGWTLSGGASIVASTLQDGSTGYVLDMPKGAVATSPTFCVSSNYPTAKAVVRDVFGPPNLSFYVTYATTGRTPSTGAPSPPSAWALSPPLKLYPSSTPGWQLATFTFVAGNHPSDVHLYNFYVDPYAK